MESGKPVRLPGEPDDKKGMYSISVCEVYQKISLYTLQNTHRMPTEHFIIGRDMSRPNERHVQFSVHFYILFHYNLIAHLSAMRIELAAGPEVRFTLLFFIAVVSSMKY